MKRILVVDDDADILDALGGVLSESYRVEVASNGEQALGLLERQRFDAMVLDLMMPVMDGSELLRVLRARGLWVPVLVASANPRVRERSRELGAADWLAKPYELRVLERKLARLVGGGGEPTPGAGAGGGGVHTPGTASWMPTAGARPPRSLASTPLRA